MQLIIGVRGCWKYVEVKLVEGCLPSIGGKDVDEQNIEPALWFKVLVLDNVCIDCSERVISWTVKTPSSHSTPASTHLVADGPSSLTASTRSGDHQLLSTSTASLHSILSSPTLSPIRGPSVVPGNHSLMAPHDGEAGLCTDDLQSLFELSEVLYRVNNTSASSSPRASRAATVERRSWIRLLHCYLLPLITLHHEDLDGVHQAYTNHTKLLDSLDQRIFDTSEQTMKVKEKLSHLHQQLLPRVREWTEHRQCSHKFLAIVTSDLQQTEDNARAMIQSSQRNLELLTSPLSSELAEKFRADMIKGEHLLISSLELRSSLEGLMSTLDLGRGSYREEGEECWVVQQAYIQLHTQLAALRARSADLSRKKVLALSVREALEQTMYCLQHGRATTGIDVGLQGGHSTDVLPESSLNQSVGCNEYLTLKDKLEKLLHQSSSAIAIKHSSFCKMLTTDLLRENSTVRSFSRRNKPESKGQRLPTDLPELAALVKRHFEETVEEVCQHFNSYQVEFVQQTWLCYERVFFELFSSDFMTLYQAHFSKQCEQLMMNALSASLIEPQHLNLHIGQVTSLQLFPPRNFEEAVVLYQHLTEDPGQDDVGCLDRASEEFKDYFGGVISDIASLSLTFSPLDRSQLLTSAFRKLMASLSRMKLAPLVAQSIEEGSDSVDLNLAAVSCDEMLPVLVLVLLQLKPTMLSKLNLHCCFLSDYIAPFLSPGWHGYSLAAFSSALHVLSNL